jgi:phenylalanyl-tRNA synthetase beta chain
MELATIGSETRIQRLSGVAEELMVGMGFQQAISFILSNEEKENKKMNQEGRLCKLTNPMNQNYTVVRKSLIPSLLEFLSKNQHNEFPQKVFEVGKVVVNLSDEKIFASSVITSSTVNYEEISSVLESLISNLGHKLKLEKATDARFISGRVAKVSVDGRHCGVVGEINPVVLENFGLETPVTCFEIDLGFLMEEKK